ncbi:MAG: translation initiation factor IF-2, partial [Proteobacteria bacterium]|nr:translation initiation factor IF-2 [Pseudomonadota bacterium]
MSNPKVFEFAKEIGMTPLALMDKIREWQLPVKSHMAELDPGTLEAIKTKLYEKSGPAAAGPEKKAVSRKKVSAPTPVKAVSAKAAVTTAPTAAAKPTGGTVVRRKKAEEPVREVKAEEPAASVAAEVAPVAVALAPANESPAVATVTPPRTSPAGAIPTALGAAPSAMTTAEMSMNEDLAEKKSPARKKEVAIGNSGVASSAPKRNIIGRMDLSRVATVAPSGGQRPERGPHSGPRPASSGAGGGFASTRPGGKGNLRAGFVAPVSIPDTPGFDEEYERKKEEKRRTKGGAIEAAAPKVNEEEENQHFDAAEFRKREMV